ncbi:MAG: hypothetical protein AAGF58_04420, partial [Pseudomonadota bacterium]
FRRKVMTGRLLGAHGRVEKEGRVIHLKVRELVDLSDRLLLLQEEALRNGLAPSGGRNAESGGDFAGFLARADEVRNPQEDRRQVRWPKSRSFR